MPKIDLTITISVIVALASIISPIITTALNNRHQYKIKKLELEQLEYERTTLYKRKIFENYLKGLSMVSQCKNPDAISIYAEYYPLAFMYLPEHIQSKMTNADRIVTSHNYSSLSNHIDELSKDIYKELQKL